MKKIAVITATRAEYGLLYPVIRELRKYENEELTVSLIVTGTHLSEDYGMTVQEIRSSGLRIDYEIPVPVDSRTAADISSNQAFTLTAFTQLFQEERFHAILILGDRYEMLAIAIAAGNTRTPVFHMCGGDTTEGAMDEWIRHSITKISYLHFPTNEQSRRRVIQLGESPDRVFNYGSTSIDNILRAADLEKTKALTSIGLQDCSYAICTYHPVTMEDRDVDSMILSFLDAISNFPELQFIITKSNADQGGARINDLLDQADKELQNVHVFSSLGIRRYLSLMRHAKFVLGNSSSGIIEAPAFHIPTVNIGNRQNGRLQSPSILNCTADTDSIIQTIHTALSETHRKKCLQVASPYGDGHAAEHIAAKTVEMVTKGTICLQKKFYDLQGGDF